VDSPQETTDKAMMARCIELSRIAVTKGEYPFGTVIALDGQVVAEAINRTVRDGDVTRHAEVIALSEAQKTIGREQLYRYTLYTNIEPCAMCSYCIREARVGRVVYALGSPVMGGLSKWNILRDDEMSDRIPQIFGAVPEVVSGILLHEAQQAWRDWNPLAWQMIKLRGLLTEPCVHDGHVHMQPAHRPSIWHYLQRLFARRPPASDRGASAECDALAFVVRPLAVGTLPVVDQIPCAEDVGRNGVG
jgi:tRNA(adenine34) deaminase